MSTRFSLHPQALKRAISDLIGFAHFSTAGDRIFNVPSISLSVSRTEGSTGELAIVGLSKYTAGRLIVDVEGVDGDDNSEVLVLAKSMGKSSVVDDLTKIGSALTGTAKDARCYVEIVNRSRLLVENNGELVGELADTQASTRDHDWVEEQLDRQGYARFDGSLALSLSTITRLSNLKYSGEVADLAQIPGEHKVVAAQVGENFTGLMTTVNREIYAEGGPWGSGSGTPEALIPTA